MASVNKVILVGNLGSDPETRTFPSGDQVCNVAIATNEKWKDKQTGEAKEHVEYHRLVFNGRLAEIAAQYLRKGSQVYVEGSIRTRKYNDKDGVEKYATDIRVDQMQMLGGKPEQGGEQRAPQQRRAPAPQAASTGSGFDDMADDIPFATNSPYFDETTSKSRRMKRYGF